LWTPEGSGLFLPQRLGNEVMIVSKSKSASLLLSNADLKRNLTVV
jgi:hypothetical protein